MLIHSNPGVEVNRNKNVFYVKLNRTSLFIKETSRDEVPKMPSPFSFRFICLTCLVLCLTKTGVAQLEQIGYAQRNKTETFVQAVHQRLPNRWKSSTSAVPSVLVQVMYSKAVHQRAFGFV